MFGMHDRRSFLKMAGRAGISLAGLSLLGMPAKCLGAAYDPIEYWIENGFNEERFREKTIINRAMAILHNRFRDLHVVRNVYRVLGSRG